MHSVTTRCTSLVILECPVSMGSTSLCICISRPYFHISKWIKHKFLGPSCRNFWNSISKHGVWWCGNRPSLIFCLAADPYQTPLSHHPGYVGVGLASAISNQQQPRHQQQMTSHPMATGVSYGSGLPSVQPTPAVPSQIQSAFTPVRLPCSMFS